MAAIVASVFFVYYGILILLDFKKPKEEKKGNADGGAGE